MTDTKVNESSQTLHFNATPPPFHALDKAGLREPLATIDKYYHPKTFLAAQGSNALIAASAALLALIGKLKTQTDYTHLKQLRENLIHEIKAFECQAHAQGYSEENIIIARFALCATLDETIQATAWGKQHHWHRNNLLYYFQGEIWGGETFFIILDKLTETPNEYLDLIELFYLCLSLGFQGKYRRLGSDEHLLEHEIDSIFQLIRNHRGDHSAKLSKPFRPFFRNSRLPKKTGFFLKLIALSATSLVVIYLGFNYLLGITVSPLYHKLDQINHMNHYEKTH